MKYWRLKIIFRVIMWQSNKKESKHNNLWVTHVENFPSSRILFVFVSSTAAPIWSSLTNREKRESRKINKIIVIIIFALFLDSLLYWRNIYKYEERAEKRTNYFYSFVICKLVAPSKFITCHAYVNRRGLFSH